MSKKGPSKAKEPVRRAGSRAGAGRTRRPYVVLAVLALLAVVLYCSVALPYRVPSRAMEDTLLAGDYVLLEKLSYGAQLPFALGRLPALGRVDVGDVVVFHLPDDAQRVYVKRCMATEGQVVEIVDKVLYVDGVRVPDPPHSKYIDARIMAVGQSTRDNWGPVEVPPGSFFLVGDNRDNSRDSRAWGFIPVEMLVGRAVAVLFSLHPLAGADDGPLWAALGGLPERVRWTRPGTWVD